MCYCYLCDKKIPVGMKSEEHIIPNAIGGKLKTFNALCKPHNSDLGSKLDADFVSIFAHISKLVPISTDRQVGKKFIGRHIGHDIEVSITAEKIVPNYLKFVKETLTLYAPSKALLEQYLKKLESEGYDLKKIKCISEFHDGKVEIFSGFENRIFKQGFAKIAAGFAAHNGIKAQEMNLILENNSFIEDILLLENFPNDLEIFMFPPNQTEFYPFHIIALHSDKTSKHLYCYIELFSKFKHYILLGENFEKEIHEFYIYSICKKQEFKISDYIDLFPKFAEYKESQNLLEYYKAKRIEEYLIELEKTRQTSDILQKLAIMDSIISNEFIEKFVGQNHKISVKDPAK